MFVGLYSLSSRLFLSKHNSLANWLSRRFLQLGFCDELYRLPSWSLLSNQHERLRSFTVPCWSIQQQIGYRLHSLWCWICLQGLWYHSETPIWVMPHGIFLPRWAQRKPLPVRYIWQCNWCCEWSSRVSRMPCWILLPGGNKRLPQPQVCLSLMLWYKIFNWPYVF